MRRSRDSADAKLALRSSPFNLSEDQADAVLGLRLTRLTALEEDKLTAEVSELKSKISELSDVMTNDSTVYKIMVNETRELQRLHGVPRKSLIWKDEAALTDQDLLPNDRSVIMMTSSGYVKRVPILEFESQLRGGRGKAGAKLSAVDDAVSHFFSCNDHDTLMFISNGGIAYSIKAYKVPVGSRTAKGVPLPQVLPINSDDKITSVIPIDSFGDEESLVLLTKKGYVKKTPLKAFTTISSRGLTIIGLEVNDTLSWARRCLPDEQILIATRDGFASRFSTVDVSSTGRTARGCRALSLREGDEMADFDIVPTTLTNLPEKYFVLCVTEKGYGKRVEIDDLRLQRRGGKGMTVIKFKAKAGGGRTSKVVENGDGPDALSCMRICTESDEIVISTGKGTVVRQRVSDLPIQSRAATGVLIQKLDENDRVVMVDVVPSQINSDINES